MAAAVYIPASPHGLFGTMSTNRRAALANIPNATNSPHRTLTNSNKRPRASINILQQENEPPQKRQVVEKLKDSANPATPRRRMNVQSAEGKVFEAGPANAEANSFQRRLVAAREKGAPVKVAKNEAQQQKEAENIRQWQKHYRKIFPTFSFYFESIPEDMRARFTRQVTALGAVRAIFHVLYTLLYFSRHCLLSIHKTSVRTELTYFYYSVRRNSSLRQLPISSRRARYHLKFRSRDLPPRIRPLSRTPLMKVSLRLSIPRCLRSTLGRPPEPKHLRNQILTQSGMHHPVQISWLEDGKWA
jgi:hypothetical protein